MFDVKKYRLGFDAGGLILFAIIMVPNLIWFVIPAGNDILRGDSITPVIDLAASVFQVIMVAALCLIKNETYYRCKNRKWMISIVVSVAIYYQYAILREEWNGYQNFQRECKVDSLQLK